MPHTGPDRALRRRRRPTSSARIRRCATRGTRWRAASTSAPRRWRHAARHACRAVPRRRRRGGRRARPVPAPRGAAVDGHDRGRLPGVSVPRLDVRRRGPLRARAVGRRARAAATARAPVDVRLRRAVRPGVGVPRQHAGRRARRHPGHRPRARSGVPPHQHPGRRVADLGDAHDRQLPRHHALPVRARRHVRAGAGHASAEVRARAARRRLVRLPLRGAGEQHRPRHARQRPGRRRGRAGDELGVPPAVRRAQHDPLRHRARAHPAAAVDARSTTSRRTSRSSCGATTTSRCRPRRSSASTWRSAPRTSGCSSCSTACCRSTRRRSSACRPTSARSSGAAA